MDRMRWGSGRVRSWMIEISSSLGGNLNSTDMVEKLDGHAARRAGEGKKFGGVGFQSYLPAARSSREDAGGEPALSLRDSLRLLLRLTPKYVRERYQAEV